MRVQNLLFLVTLPLFIILSGCSKDLDINNDEEIITKDQRKYKGFGKFFGEDTLLFGGDDNRGKKADVGIGVNTYLWRATLDTLSFLPLKSVDPFGGVIITDWYSDPKTPHERVKVNVRILDRMLRADGLTISIFKETRKKGHWVSAPVSKQTAQDLEDAILMKARLLKMKR